MKIKYLSFFAFVLAAVLIPCYANATVTFITSGTSWTVPADWNNSNNTIEVIGGGAGGTANSNGGGGGAYSKKTNVTLTGGSTVTIQVGSGGAAATSGGDTYVCNSTSNCGSIGGGAVIAGAKGGAASGVGGSSSSGVGDTKVNGGSTSGTEFCGSSSRGGGSGAGGPNGAGGNSHGTGSCDGSHGGVGGGGNGGGSTASNLSDSFIGGNGGNNSSGTGGGTGGVFNSNGRAGSNGGGGGGSGGNGAGGGVGGNGTEWDSTHGSGGGGGSGDDLSPSGGGNGGLYGAGGGSGPTGTTQGLGAQGIIVITYAATGGAQPADTTAPTISAVSSSSITSSGATISFSTNEFSDTQIEYGLTTSYGSQTSIDTSLVSFHSASISSLSAGTLYNYRVKSRDSSGNLSTSGNFTFTTASVAVSDTTAPSVPTSLSATAISSSAINLAWSASTDAVGVSGYKVYRAGVQIGTASSNSYSDTSLTASTLYTYTVSSYDAAGNNSSQSSSASATTQAAAASGSCSVGTSSCTAATGSASDVQSAINNVAAGGTITIPNGSYTWNSAVTISGKTVRLIGATKGGVIITNSLNCTDALLNINESTSGNTEVANIRFLPGSTSTTCPGGTLFHLKVNGLSGGKPTLVHDNYFSTGYWYAILMNTNHGVIYNNVFEDVSNGTVGLSGISLVDWTGQLPWTSPSTLGTLDTTGEKNLYIEDNVFNNILVALNNDDNSRVVFRNNTMNNTGISGHGQETSAYGARQFEVYNNIFTFNQSGTTPAGVAYPLNLNYWFMVRGGTGVIFNNAMPSISSSSWGTKISLWFTVFNINRIGQTPCQVTYPAARQVGQGWIGSGGYSYPNVPANGTGYATDPVYIWGNTGTGSTGSNFFGLDQYAPDECGNGQLVGDYIKVNRDYIFATKPGYTAFQYPHPLRTGGTVVVTPSTYTIAVSKAGAGSGTVVSSGGSITCGSTCSSSGITSGTASTLTATAASGSTFSGWSGGGCSGTGTCTVNITSDITVVATFAAAATQSGTTINAATCSFSDVQNAINQASDGNTVMIPAGKCTWSSGMTISKAIKVQGAGAGRVIGRSSSSVSAGTGSKTFITQSGLPITVGQALHVERTGGTVSGGNPTGQRVYMDGIVTSYSGTTLTMNMTSSSGTSVNQLVWIISTNALTTIVNSAGSSRLIVLNGSSVGNTELSGIRFVAGTGTDDYLEITGSANSQPVLVHDIYCESTANYDCIQVSVNRGVVWNSSFVALPFSMAQTGIHHVVFGDTASWLTPSTMGMADVNGTRNFYVEDSDFHGWLNATDFDSNARAVMRYVLFDNAGFGTHGADSSAYGQRHFEFYNSEMTWNGFSDGTTLPFARGFFLRGGTGVIADNVLNKPQGNDYPSNLGVNFIIINLKRITGPHPCWGADIPGIQYPAPRQIGRGYVDGASGMDTFFYVDGTYTTALGDSEPLYYWNNTSGFTLGTSDDTDTACANTDSTSSYVVAGRDYILSQKPNYTKYTYPHPARSGASVISPPVVITPTPDTTLPTVSMTSPNNGATVSGTSVSIAATASDNIGVVGVQFKLDGNNLGSELTTAPYSGAWDTTGVSNGSHTLTATARDAAGNIKTSSAVTITVSNVVIDTTAPTVPTGLTSSSVTQTTATLSWNLSTDAVGVTGYRVYRNGALIASPTTNTYAVTGLSSGTTYSFTVAARDLAGNVSGQSSPLSLTTSSAPVVTYTISVTKSGAGAGTISGAGISCGVTCSAIITSGTTAVLTATPASDSTFSGWSGGGCSGTGSCTSSISTNTTITATFALTPISTPSGNPSGGGGGGSSGGSSSSGSGTTPTTGTLTPTVTQRPTTVTAVTSVRSTNTSSIVFTSTLNLTVGSSNPDIKALQTFLNSKGFTVSASGAGSKGLETNYFGPATQTALIKFQAANGLPATGLLGPLTRSLINSLSGINTTSTTQTTNTKVTGTLSRSLYKGISGTDVITLQKLLNSKGYTVAKSGAGSPGYETTLFGPATENAVKAFQCAKMFICSGSVASNGYGFVGAKTRVELGK